MLTHTLASAWQKSSFRKLVWVSLCIFLSLLTVAAQLILLRPSNPERLAFLEEGKQMLYHQDVINGVAGDPWQYRILAPYLLEGAMRTLDPLQLPHTPALVFIGLRLLQNCAIFGLMVLYYRKLGLGDYVIGVGLSISMAGLVLGSYGNDLTFNTYFDVIFYLLGANLILNSQWAWLPLVMIFAAFNRETSGLIPLWAGLVLWFYHRQKTFNQSWVAVILALSLYIAIFIGLRLSFGEQRAHTPALGWEALRHNLTEPYGWVMLLNTVGLVPFLGLLVWRKWHPVLFIFFCSMTPLWLAIHLVSSLIGETRLFLVPLLVVWLPAALSGLAFPQNLTVTEGSLSRPTYT